MVPSPAGIGVVVTCCRRPGYLRRTLGSWSRVRGVENVRRFAMAVGASEKLAEVAAVIDGSGLNAEMWFDSPAARACWGMHRAIGEAVDKMFTDPGVDYVVLGEEDIIVSDDVLEYFTWAFGRMYNDMRILLACAHNRGGTGWDDLYSGPQDAGASQEAVRALPYYNPWGWGISRYHWEHVLRGQWDWDCSTGTAEDNTDSGYDWNIQKRAIPGGGWLCLVPDAARSQNIGEHDGVNSSPDIFLLQLAESFELHREPVAYKLEE